MDHKHHLQAAQGYAELGMIEDALKELDEIPEPERQSELAACVRLDIFTTAKRWQDAAKVAREGIAAHPDCSHLYIMGAFAIRRAETVKAAKEFLVKGHLCMDETKPERPLFWFNLGCYHSVLGQHEEALQCVGVAVEGDEKYKRMALEDEDLKPLWDSLAVKWP